MFTGLIEALGTVRGLRDDGAGKLLVIDHPTIRAEARVSESIAINGACLTVVSVTDEGLAFQVGPETLLKTNLGQLKSGDFVNLERSLKVGDRLGGHWVQGHVDGVGAVAERRREGDWEMVWFSCPAVLCRQMVSKGSIAIDGVSLTLVEVERDRCSVALIPYTMEHTTLGHKQPGATVNIETDILGKYVCKLMENR